MDIPSGWDVNSGDVNNSGFMPEAVVSLTAPNRYGGYKGEHYGGALRATIPSGEVQDRLTRLRTHVLSSVVKYSSNSNYDGKV